MFSFVSSILVLFEIFFVCNLLFCLKLFAFLLLLVCNSLYFSTLVSILLILFFSLNSDLNCVFSTLVSNLTSGTSLSTILVNCSAYHLLISSLPFNKRFVPLLETSEILLNEFATSLLLFSTIKKTSYVAFCCKLEV